MPRLKGLSHGERRGAKRVGGTKNETDGCNISYRGFRQTRIDTRVVYCITGLKDSLRSFKVAARAVIKADENPKDTHVNQKPFCEFHIFTPKPDYQLGDRVIPITVAQERLK